MPPQNVRIRDDSNRSADISTVGSAGALKVDIVQAVALSTSGVSALTAAAPATATVSQTSAVIVASNSSRRGLILTNIGRSSVFIAIATGAVANRGIFLGPFGTWNMGAESFVTGTINAITSGADAIVTIQEFST